MSVRRNGKNPSARWCQTHRAVSFFLLPEAHNYDYALPGIAKYGKMALMHSNWWFSSHTAHPPHMLSTLLISFNMFAVHCTTLLNIALLFLLEHSASDSRIFFLICKLRIFMWRSLINKNRRRVAWVFGLASAKRSSLTLRIYWIFIRHVSWSFVERMSSMNVWLSFRLDWKSTFIRMLAESHFILIYP